jgi:hypothetical protein
MLVPIPAGRAAWEMRADTFRLSPLAGEAFLLLGKARMEQEQICPECGASGSLCQTRFDEFLALEFSDPGYGAVHHLTVAAYMLQHSSKLTREGWLYERELLREFLVENKPPALVRQQNRDVVDSGKRQFKIKSRTGQPVIAKTAWARTICDVRTESAEIYCKDVTEWARAVLEDAEKISEIGK